jgi:molybdopterin converting factor small subunit
MSALEQRLAEGGEVRLQKREAQDVLQKLRARGAVSESADRIESQLASGDEVVLTPHEAGAVLDELRASGRRWVFGSDAPREHEPPRAAPPEPQPEPEPERKGWIGRMFGR